MPGRLTSVGQMLLDGAAPAERSRWSAALLSLALLAACAALDYAAGTEINLIALYLVPLFVATWSLGRGAGIVLAVASAALSTAGDIAAGATYRTPLVPWTMTLLWAGLFAAFVLVLTQLRRALEREKALARVDALTGVANRRYFVELLGVELSRARRSGRALTVAYVDLDNFKEVNDQRGHHAGDELLRLVARTMRGRLRVTDSIGRMGGDEFAICLPETAIDSAEVVLADVRQQVVAAVARDTSTVTLSLGAVACTLPPESVDALLQRADEALYAAKRNGKNNIRLERG
jgi:diguanylate cyclase (GGDEF)-like protein